MSLPLNLEKGIQAPNLTESDSLLIEAAENGHLDRVKYLVEKGANVNIRDGVPLAKVFDSGHIEIAQYLIEHGAYLNSTDQKILLQSKARQGDISTVQALLDYGIDPNIDNGEALKEAVWTDCLETARLLLESGADPNLSEYILKYAQENKNPEMIQLLEDYGADFSSISPYRPERKDIMGSYHPKYYTPEFKPPLIRPERRPRSPPRSFREMSSSYSQDIKYRPPY